MKYRGLVLPGFFETISREAGTMLSISVQQNLVVSYSDAFVSSQ